MKRTVFYIMVLALCSCAVQRPTTSEEFAKDVQKDLPFKVTELKAVSNHDNTYSFRSDGYIGLLPDYEVDSEGAPKCSWRICCLICSNGYYEQDYHEWW